MIKILKTELLHEGKWLKLHVSHIENAVGKSGIWEFSSRKSMNPPVVCIAKTENNELVMIKQFRVPIKAWQYEFPAGIGEDGEDLVQVAIREFEEETGYKSQVISDSNASLGISPELSASAGLTNETYYIAKVKITGKGKTHFDDHEDIQLHLLKLEKQSITDFLLKVKNDKEIIDAKLYSYLLGVLDYMS